MKDFTSFTQDCDRKALSKEIRRKYESEKLKIENRFFFRFISFIRYTSTSETSTKTKSK